MRSWNLRIFQNYWNLIFTAISLHPFSGRLPIFPLFGLVYFDLASSSAKYFSVISFCLTDYIYGLLSTAYRAIVPLASVVYALMDEVGPGTCVVFLVGRTGACALVCEAETFPSDEQGHITWCFGVSAR